MTHDQALHILIEVLSSDIEADDDDVLAAMVERGVPLQLADRTFNFTQIAWGRAFLDGVGVRFPDCYICFDRDGDVVESGKLSDESSFVAANESLEENIGSPWFNRLALTSADARTVNQALKAGSRPEKLVAGPPAIFVEAPTELGVQRAQQKLQQRIMESRED